MEALCTTTGGTVEDDAGRHRGFLGGGSPGAERRPRFRTLLRNGLLGAFALMVALVTVDASAQTQTGTITGTVTDVQTGQGIPGVNVVIVGTQQGTATNAEGLFTAENPVSASVQPNPVADISLQEDESTGFLNENTVSYSPDLGNNHELTWSVDFVKDTNPDDRTDHYTPRIRDEPADSDLRPALVDSLSARNYGFTGFGLAIPLPDFVDEFPTDDLRRSSNIIESMFGIPLNFPYMPKLWNLDQINSPRVNHGENRIVFRLADVYLMAVEAENELNGPDDAYPYVNAVRERAYEPDQPLEGLSQSQLRDAIREERRWEPAGEGQRRLDLIRWGILEEVVRDTEYRVYNPAANIQPRHTLLPIPPVELQLNPNLLTSDPSNNGYR